MKFFKAMSAKSGIAFVLVPHLDPKHDSLMVELLARQTTMPVLEAREGEPIQVNHVYIIPPNKFLAIKDGRLRLSVLPDPRGRQTALDTFLRSLAEEQAERAIGIVLSGTGSHGTLGLKEIKMAGGMAMVQEPESAGFDQMPRSAIATGLIDYVLPPERMPEAILAYVRQPYVSTGPVTAPGPESSPELLNRILVLLKARTRYDFRSYRKNMLLRRIQRRMGLSQVDRLGAYLELIRENQDESRALCKDLLIGVTGFFRDPEAFQVLEQRVIPELVARKGGEAPLRVWVPGCSSGEEAYSIAMLLIEQFSQAKIAMNTQIFASDLDEDALAVARRGIYSESVAGDLSADRLRRFFTTIDDHSYQVNKALRDAVVFAPQNLIGDAPFSKLDLITCRNLLIYLEPEVQKKVIALFHFALNEGGYLMLGPSETIGRQADLFEVISARWRIYQRKAATRRQPIEIPLDFGMSGRLPIAGMETLVGTAAGLEELMRKKLLADYAPAAVLINRRFEVLCFLGPTVNYLEFPSGEPTRNLLALARQGLRTKLRAVVSEASHTGESVTDSCPHVRRDGNYVPCKLTAKPFGEPKTQDDLLLVIFEDRLELPPGPTRRGEILKESALTSQLENELRTTREELRGTIEEMESSNEELKASNEEMMSMNEELQSVNEELETSKEELQSTNEELNTVNSQLNQKILELNAVNNDISNLFNSIDIPTVFLTTDARIRRFTPAAIELFNLLATDFGRPIGDVTRKFTNDQLVEDCQAMLEKQTPIERELRAENGQFYLRRVLPYWAADHRLDGVVVTFIDLTESKRTADLVNEARLYAESIVATVREPLVVLDASLRVRSANPSFYRSFRLRAEDAVDRPLFALAEGRWDTPPLRRTLEEVLSRSSDVVDFELELPFEEIGDRTMLLNARAIPALDDRPPLILLAIEDITPRKRAEQELKTLNQTLEDRVSSRTAEARMRAAELEQSERDLRAQEQILHAVLQSLGEGVVVSATDGTFLVFNPAAIGLIGLGPTDVGPSEWQRYYGIFLADQTTPCPLGQFPMMRAIGGEEVREMELFFRNEAKPEGVWLSVSSSPLYDDGATVIGGVCVIRDITERKRAEDLLRESETRLRAIVTTAVDAIVTIDEKGLIESCNPAAEQMFGYSAGAMIGQNIDLLIPPVQFDLYSADAAQYLKVGESSIHARGREVIGRRSDGSTLPVDLTLSESHEGTFHLFTGVMRDISERKKLQQELLSIAEAEQRRIGQDLHDDIGQELTGLAMKAETLFEIVTEREIPEHALAADIVAGLDRTRSKVRALSRGMVPVEIDSSGLVSALEELTARLGDVHNISCAFECPDRSIEIDQHLATQLYHIAQEGITNALKHARAQNIRVTLEARESAIKLQISDDGVGMPASGARTDGMGLRIMYYRAALIHGKLDVRSNATGGTVVSCLIMRGTEHGTGDLEGPRPEG